MTNCCGCYSAFQPRYKRLVDSIFPADPKDGLVKANMDKLTFFAIKSPEKLDRIGEYLAQRVNRDINKNRFAYVHIAMEALDILLITCHAQSLNLFVESFLKMIQKLLENKDPDLQILATASFVKFANIEEDTPSYNRHYDFFISQFSALSHTNDSHPQCVTLRVAGLQGLHGVIRKTVRDDLQFNIWKYVDKIIPSLLFNMENSDKPCEAEDPERPRDDESPPCVAENVLRDFVCRASYGNVTYIIKPVLIHLDNHNLWVPDDFAVKCFKIIMYSIQSSFGHLVVHTLIKHLDENSKEYPKIKVSIVHVLSQTVLISAGGSIGPSVLEIFNTLLKHLKISVDQAVSSREKAAEEKHFQEAIVNTIGEFTNNLPDYQKIEIMMFVMSRIPTPKEKEKIPADIMLQTMLLKSLLKIATKYRTFDIQKALPSSFLDPLLSISLAQDPGIRRLVQEIFHSLIDRNKNLEKLKNVEIHKEIETSQIKTGKPQKQDILFIKKNGPSLFWHLNENSKFNNNKVDNFESIYVTMILVAIEMNCDDSFIDLIQLALEIQTSSLSSSTPVTHKCAMNALVASYLSFSTFYSNSKQYNNYIDQVIKARESHANYFLPDVAFNRSNTSSSYPTNNNVKDACLFKLDTIKDKLKSSGMDVSRLNNNHFNKPISQSHPDTSLSNSDIQSILEPESPSSSPTTGKKSLFEEITFESMKKALVSDPEEERNEKLKQQRLYDSFRTDQFEVIVAKSGAKSQNFRNELDTILNNIPNKKIDKKNNNKKKKNNKIKNSEEEIEEENEEEKYLDFEGEEGERDEWEDREEERGRGRRRDGTLNIGINKDLGFPSLFVS